MLSSKKREVGRLDTLPDAAKLPTTTQDKLTRTPLFL